MQSSSPVKSGSAATTTNPATAVRNAESSASTSTSPRVQSPRQAPKLGFDSPLRMHDFYNADPAFRKLSIALKSSAANAGARQIVDGLTSQVDVIRKSVLEAEKLFAPHSRTECALRLEAAKANQVRLLGEIDDAPADCLAAGKREDIRDACTELGKGLSKMLVQAKALEKARLDGQLSPARESRKRPAEHPDSPPETGKSPKRRKTEALSPQADSVFSPRYRAASQDEPALAHSATNEVGATSITSNPSAGSASSSSSTPLAAATTSPTHAPLQAMPTSPPSPMPQGKRRLAPQRRPRPASQLFAAPPFPDAKPAEPRTGRADSLPGPASANEQ